MIAPGGLMQTEMEKVYEGKDWPSIRQHFLNTYADPTLHNKLIADLDRLIQLPGERVQAYHEKYDSLCARAGFDDTQNVSRSLQLRACLEFKLHYTFPAQLHTCYVSL